jgi:Lrp/AsnC family leucine-responsive transcriptional regulator
MIQRDFKLDEIHKKIIEVIQENARISNLDLADRINLSPSACLKRTRKLEEQGYIRKYTVDLDLDRMCEHVEVLASIMLLEEHAGKTTTAFEEAICSIPQTVECVKVSGEVDFIARFICTDVAQYNEITESLIGGNLGVARIVSHFVLSTPKRFWKYPLDELLQLDEKT